MLKGGNNMVIKTECVVCSKEIEIKDVFNGEMMCQECYINPENEVFEE